MMTLPNLITSLRYVLVFIGVILIVFEMRLAGTTLITIAMGLDVVDGFVARKLRQTSLEGRYLDTLVDKITIISCHYIVAFRYVPDFFLVAHAILFREYTYDILRSYAENKGFKFSPNFTSKVKGVGQMVVLLIALWLYTLSFDISKTLSTLLTLTTALFTFYSYVTLLTNSKSLWNSIQRLPKESQS